MKVSGIAGVGVVAMLGLSAGRALAQDEDMEKPSAPAPVPAAAADKDAPAAAAPPAKAEPEAPAAHVVWKQAAPGAAESTEATSSDAEQAQAPAASLGWSLGGSHFALSIERVTSVLAWSKKVTIQPTGGLGEPLTVETTGTDVSFLSAGALRSASGVPRVAFDVIFDGGFSIGGSISYMTTSGKLAANSLQPGADLPDASLFLFAPRVGVLLVASDSLGVWLRGGVTHSAGTSSSQFVSNGTVATETDTVTAWDLTLDPTLVFVAVPHVCLTVSGLVEVGVAGTQSAQVDGQSTSIEADYGNTNYGVTAGMTALF